MQIKLFLYHFIFLTFIFFNNIISQGNKKIPDWFLKNVNHQNEIYAIGISDPNLDTIKGENQAILRALVYHSLLHKSHINELSTYGLTNENSVGNNAKTIENAVYTSIYSIGDNLTNLFSVEKKYTNIYKETFVLLKFNSDSLIKFDYKIIRRLGFQKEDNVFPVFIDEVELIANFNDTLLCKYKINKLVNKSEIKSKLIVNKEVYKINFINKKYVYNGINYQNNIEYLSNRLNYGVWLSFFTGIIEKSSLFSNLNSSQNFSLSTVNQGNIRNKSKSKALINLNFSAKSISKSNFNFKIEKIDLISNNLNIIFDFEDKIKLKNINEENLTRKEKKVLNKMLSQNWKCFGYSDFENAWKIFKSYKNNINENIIVSADQHISSNLNSGIFKSVLFSKIDISNQLNLKTNSLSNVNNSDKKAYELNSAKTSNLQQKIKFWPYFIFYRKTADKNYEIKTFFFYSAI